MLQKKISLLTFLLLILFSCSETTNGASQKQTYTIVGEILNTERDSIGLWDFVGAEPKLISQIPLKKDGSKSTFSLKADVESEGVYYLALKMTPQERQGFEIVLGSQKVIEITADSKELDKTLVFKNSKENKKFNELMQKTSEYQGKLRTINQELQQIMQSPTPDTQKQAELQKQSDAVYFEQAEYHASMAKDNDLIAKIAGAYYYIPYGYGDSKTKFKDEEEFIQTSFFSKVDFKDPINGYLPVYYYKMQNYCQMLLMSYQYDYTQFISKMEPIMKQLPLKSKVKQVTIFSILNAAAASQKYNANAVDIFVNYSKIFVKDFPNDPKTPHFQSQIDQLGKAMIGSDAPDIDLENPEGKKIKLSSLKGKIVLIDFWASWCGPCRRENPNVVKVYEEYKNKGFDIYSVSLDKEKEKWIDAIKSDNLTWKNHVSDLQGWQSGAAKLFGVTSIPKTFLIGKDGTIIAKDLRGEALEKKLAEVLNKK